jgi:tetratricopeptide (TPR) repeat protein
MVLQTSSRRVIEALHSGHSRAGVAVLRVSLRRTTPLWSGSCLHARGSAAGARVPELGATVLAIEPRAAAAANNLAWIYSEHGGDKDKALQLAQMAKKVTPDDPRVSDTLGSILYKRGIYQNALSLLKESAAKLGDNPQVQHHLGMVYAQLGDQANARKALNAAIGSPADFQGKDEARKALASLK